VFASTPTPMCSTIMCGSSGLWRLWCCVERDKGCSDSGGEALRSKLRSSGGNDVGGSASARSRRGGPAPFIGGQGL
jgi:hypothetical protein